MATLPDFASGGKVAQTPRPQRLESAPTTTRLRTIVDKCGVRLGCELSNSAARVYKAASFFSNYHQLLPSISSNRVRLTLMQHGDTTKLLKSENVVIKLKPVW